MRLLPGRIAHPGVTLSAIVTRADRLAPDHGVAKTSRRVDRDHDGDSPELPCVGQSRRARLLGHDAPETRPPRCPAEAALGAKAMVRRHQSIKCEAITLVARSAQIPPRAGAAAHGAKQMVGSVRAILLSPEPI